MAIDALDTAQRDQARDVVPARQAHTLVVGFDESEEACAALRAAIDRSGPEDTVCVVNVYPRISEWMGYPYYNQAVAQARHDARRILRRACTLVEDSQAEIVLEIHEGAPADVLARIGARQDADEIIVGTRGLGRIRAALGSVAQELMRTADRPVLVVPAKSVHAG